MKKSGIMNLKIYKKLALTIGGALLVGSLTGCATKKEEKQEKVVVENISFGDVLNENKDNTYLDEILNLNEDISNSICNVYYDRSTSCYFKALGIEQDEEEEIYLSTCINKLETYMNLINKINSLSYNNTDELNSLNEKMQYNLFSKINDIEYVNGVIEKFNSENITNIEKARCMQELQYFNVYYKTYIKHNGLTITEDLLKKALKSYACQISGLEPENYANCSISGNSSAKKRTITLVDPVSGVEIKFVIDKDTSKIINTVLDDLYNIQCCDSHHYDTDYATVYDCCVPALTNVKKLIKAGVTLENNILIPLEDTNVKTKSKTKS